jgi:hypothetical protein
LLIKMLCQMKKDFASLLDWKNNLPGKGHLNFIIGIQIRTNNSFILL